MALELYSSNKDIIVPESIPQAPESSVEELKLS